MSQLSESINRGLQSNALGITRIVLAFVAVWLISFGAASAQTKRPNILVIWGDDVGWSNVSAYNMGMMGYRTPNIDSIAKDGMLFTDYYAQQSCTAGRSALLQGSIHFAPVS